MQAHMIQFIMTNTTGFENWTGASIDSKPVELYDINGQKLFYQFSVYKNTNLIGRIDIGANKTLGQTTVSQQVLKCLPNTITM